MIDSHAHLFLKEFDADRSDSIARARREGIEAIINIGIDPASSRAALELARSEPGFCAATGLHPCTPVADLDAALDEIRAIARSDPERVVAIGEIGLDYFWKDVEPAVQKEKLRAQLALALELDLPIVVHCRDALGDLLVLLEESPRRPPGVFHCFAGSPEEARRALNLGFHISFAGNVTYPKAEALRAAALVVPPERLLLETDSPYLPPQARRGKRNEPAFGVFTRDALAALHGMRADELDRLTSATTRRLFRMKSGAGCLKI